MAFSIEITSHFEYDRVGELNANLHLLVMNRHAGTLKRGQNMLSTFRKTAVLAVFFCSPALAGPSTSLDLLLGGDSLVSNSGKLVFSDFEYLALRNAPSTSDIKIHTLDNGLFFDSPIFVDYHNNPNLIDYIEYTIFYKVSGVGVNINSATMQSTGSSTVNGAAGAIKGIDRDDLFTGINHKRLVTGYSNIRTIPSASTSFDPLDYISISDNIFAVPEEGSAGIRNFTQTYGTTPVPSPTAALAGLALLGVVSLRRRRSA